MCTLLNQYVDVDDSVHLILARIVKMNNPNVKKEAKSDFINVGTRGELKSSSTATC